MTHGELTIFGIVSDSSLNPTKKCIIINKIYTLCTSPKTCSICMKRMMLRGGLEIIETAIIISNLRKVNELITSYSDKDDNLGKMQFR